MAAEQTLVGKGKKEKKKTGRPQLLLQLAACIDHGAKSANHATRRSSVRTGCTADRKRFKESELFTVNFSFFSQLTSIR